MVPLPVAQRKAFAPPFVNKSNEFSPDHVGRFYFLFQLIRVTVGLSLEVFAKKYETL